MLYYGCIFVFHLLVVLLLLGCQYQCKWFTGKIRLLNDLCVLMMTLNPTHFWIDSLWIKTKRLTFGNDPDCKPGPESGKSQIFPGR